MRRRAWILLASLTPLAVIAVACGIDETGLAPFDASLPDSGGNDGGGQDVVAYDVLNDVPLPPSCATLDTSCLGLSVLPDGWYAYVASFDGGACPSGDFSASKWVTNTRLAPGSCTCGCTTSGTWSCPSNATVAYGTSSCNQTSNGSPGVCVGQAGGKIQLVDAGATGNVTCTPSTAPPSPQSDAFTLCSMGCDAGVGALCVAPPGARCIVTDGIAPCPGTGMTSYVIGASASPSCTTCGCKPTAPGACSATAYLFLGYTQGQYHADSTCDDAGQNTVTSFALDGTCQLVQNGFDSFDVVFGSPPVASCSTLGAGSGDAGLASPKTVCCK